MKGMQEHIQFVQCQYSKDKRFIISPVGSWNYDCADEKSDIDTKAIVIPNLTDIVYNRCDSIEHVLPNQEHCSIADIRNFMKSIQKGNPQFLEVLFSDYIECNLEMYGEEIHGLIHNREEIARCNPKNTMRAFLGMADRNYQLCKNRTQEDHANKWLYQLARIEECMRKYLTGFSFGDCLRTNKRDALLEIKNNHYSPELILEEAEYYIKECEKHHEAYVNFYEVRWVQVLVEEIVKSVIKKSLELDTTSSYIHYINS